MEYKGKYATYHKVNDICKELPFMKSACVDHLLNIVGVDDILCDDFAKEYDKKTDVFGICKPEGDAAVDWHRKNDINFNGYLCNALDGDFAKSILFDLRVIKTVADSNAPGRVDRCQKLLSRMAEVVGKADDDDRPLVAVHCAMIGYYDILSLYTTTGSDSRFGKAYIDDLMTGRINKYIDISDMIDAYALVQTNFGYRAKWSIDDAERNFKSVSMDDRYSAYSRIFADMRRIVNDLPLADSDAFQTAANKNSPGALRFFNIDTSKFKVNALNSSLTDDEKARMLDAITGAKSIKELALSVIERRQDSVDANKLAGMIDWIIGSAIIGNPKIKDKRFPDTKDSVVISFIKDVFLTNDRTGMPISADAFHKLFGKYSYYFYNPYLIMGMSRNKSVLLDRRTEAADKMRNMLKNLLDESNIKHIRGLVARFSEEMKTEPADRINPWPKPLSADDMAWDRFAFTLAKYGSADTYRIETIGEYLSKFAFDEEGHLIDPMMYIAAESYNYSADSVDSMCDDRPEFMISMLGIRMTEFRHDVSFFGLIDSFLHDPKELRIEEYASEFAYRDYFSASKCEQSTICAFTALDFCDKACSKAALDERLTEVDRNNIREWFIPIVAKRRIELRYKAPSVLAIADLKDNATDLCGMLAYLKTIRLNGEYGMFEFADDQIPVIIPKSFNIGAYNHGSSKIENSMIDMAKALNSNMIDEIVRSGAAAKDILMDPIGVTNFGAVMIETHDKRNERAAYSWRYTRAQSDLSEYARRLYLPKDEKRGDSFYCLSKWYSEIVFPALEEAGVVSEDEKTEFLDAIETTRLSYEAYVSLNP